MPISSSEQRVDLLGPVLIHGLGGVVEVTRRMEIGVLSLLALQAGSAVGVGSLIDVLWPSDPPRTATKTLQGYVKRVRSLLGPGGAEVNHAGPAGYALEISPDQVDAIRFESMIADARTHDDDPLRVRRLDEALGMWRGEPFAGCDIDGLRPYRERLVRLRSGARVERTAAEIRLGVTADTVGAIRALLAEEPTNERLWLHLAGALYRIGNPVAALRAIGEARQQLDELVGVAVGPELVEMERRIFDHDDVEATYDRLSGGARASSPSSPAPAAVPWTLALPRWAGPLIGRDGIVDEIAALVDAESPIVTIVGPGGIGKTRCAVEAVRRANTPCRGFVDLSATATGAELAIHLAGSFGIPDRDDPVAAIAEQLSGSRASVVLDNVEQISDAAGVLRTLAGHCPNIVWVVTSQRRLGIQAERVVRLDLLGNALSGDGPSAAKALLLAAADRRGIAIDERARGGIERIATTVGGLPLALELAACQLQYLDATAVAKAMDDPLTTLVDPGHPLERHRSMRACFELGFDRLGSDAAALLVLVADRPGGVRHDDLIARWRRDIALNVVIAELADAGFVASVTDSAGQPRLVQLPLVRAFGRTCPAPADIAVVTAGLDRIVIGRALGSINATDSAMIEPDLPDLRRMMQRGLDDDDRLEQALLVGVFLIVYWWSYRITEGRQWMSSLLLRAAAGRPSAMRAHAVHVAAFLDFYVGDAATALRRLEAEGPRLTDADVLARSRLLSLHGMLDAAAGRPVDAAARTSQAIELARMAGDEQMLAVALGNGGDVATAIGEPDIARARYVESIERLRRAGLEWLAAAPHARLGDLELSDGQTRRARMWFERSITLWSSRGLGPGAPQTLAGLARLEVIEGDLDTARRHLDNALATAKRCGSRGEYPWVVMGYAALTAARGDHDAAGQLFELGLSHGRRAGHHVQRLVEAELAPFYRCVGAQDAGSSSDLLALATPLEDLPQLVAALVGP